MGNENNNDVVITGIGLVTSLGVGVAIHEERLDSAKNTKNTENTENDETETETETLKPIINHDLIKPYPLHTLPEIEWNEQIPRRGDQRQMGNWQRLGVFASGLALEDAGLKDNAQACETMDMIVCAGGGERDIEVDSLIIEESLKHKDHNILLNEKLRTELRPTLFLAQLSNLMAGNISIVHKVTGSSRTFMGEEGAGVSAFETAFARIKSGQSSHCLVGGAFVAEREDVLFVFEAINELEKSPPRPFWQRHEKGGGMVLGSAGVFLVLESREYAQKRNAKIYARLDDVAGDCGTRDIPSFKARTAKLNKQINITDNSETLVLSGASGACDILALEQNYLSEHFSQSPIRTISALFGHTLEAQFPLGLALAALALKTNSRFSKFAQDIERAQNIEQAMTQPATRAIVTSFGHQRTEGLASLSKIQGV